jgi:WD40 repeat protein
MGRHHIPRRFRLVFIAGVFGLLVYCLRSNFYTNSSPVENVKNNIDMIQVSPLTQIQIEDVSVVAIVEIDKNVLLAATTEGVYSIGTSTATSKKLSLPYKDIYSILRRDNSYFGCSWDKTCFLFDPLSGAVTHRTVLPCRTGVHGAVMTADSKRIVACTQDVPTSAYLLDPSTLQQVGRIESGDWDITSIAASPRDNTIAIGDGKGTISTYQGTDGRRLASTTITPEAFVHALSFSPDGAAIAVGFSTGDIGLLDRQLAYHPLPIPCRACITCIRYSPCGSFLLVGYGDGVRNSRRGDNVIARWNLVNRTLVHFSIPAAGAVRSITFIENGSRIAVSTSAGAVLIYDAHQCLK